MKVLFMCVANSTRSQIAEALARHLWIPQVEIQSAGSWPSGYVNPWVLTVLQEMGVDVRGLKSKGWQQLPQNFLADLNYVITLCAEEQCPNLPTTAKRISWAMPDPSRSYFTDAQMFEAYRNAVNSIKEKVESFGRANGLLKN